MDTALTQQRVIDVRASSWGRLFDCAHAWEAEHLLGMRRASGLRATLGTAIHAGTAAFDQAKLDKRPISASDAADVFIHALHNPTDDVDYKQDTSINMRQAEVIGLTLHTKYCNEISPRYEFKAVEMTMQPVEIDCGNGITIRLKGTMDRARVAREKDIDAEGNVLPGVRSGIIIPDIKSGSRLIDAEGIVQTKGRAAQLGAYQLMYEENTTEHTVGAQIIALQTTSSALAGVSKIFNAKLSMTGKLGQKGLIEYAAGFFKTGDFPPNPQSALCSEKFCARWSTCLFHE